MPLIAAAVAHSGEAIFRGVTRGKDAAQPTLPDAGEQRSTLRPVISSTLQSVVLLDAERWHFGSRRTFP